MFVCLYCLWQIASFALSGMPVGVRMALNIAFTVLLISCFTDAFVKKLIFAFLYMTMWALLEALTYVIVSLGKVSSAELELLGSVISKLLLLLLVKALQRFFRHESISALPWKDMALLLLFPVSSLLFVYYLFFGGISVMALENVRVYWLAIAMILMINVLIFVMYIKLSANLELRRKNSIFALELDLFQQNMKEKKNAMAEFRKLKHDLRHKLIFLRDLAQNGEHEKLEAYIEELTGLEDLEKLTAAQSDNSLIDALINYKYATARQYGIDFRVKLEIPTEFPLANADLCVILGNALDNAVEANAGKAVSEPYIDLKMKYQQNNLVIIVENSFDGCVRTDKRGKLLTRKTDREGHGVGLASIQNTLKKYNGCMNTEIKGNVYKLTMVMYSD